MTYKYKPRKLKKLKMHQVLAARQVGLRPRGVINGGARQRRRIK